MSGRLWIASLKIASLMWLITISVLPAQGEPHLPAGVSGGGASVPKEVAQSRFSAAFSLDVATHYFFRGIVQEDQGLIVQPAIELGLNLYAGDEDSGLGSVDLTVGLWNSLHEGPSGNSGANSSPSLWYEADFYAGIGAAFGDHWSASLTYVAYTSPNSVFSTVQEIDLGLAYDDSHLWGDSFGGLQPSVTLANEIDNQADGGTNSGTYLEIGLAPSFDIGEPDDPTLTLTIPITLGLSLDDYFEGPSGDETFGFLDVGVVASKSLSFIGESWGSWDASVGIHALWLGDSMEALNGNEDFELYGTAGVSVSF